LDKLKKTKMIQQIQLSEDEKTIMKMLCQGLTVKEMTVLYLPSKRTIERKIDGILKKMNCKNRSEAIHKATKAGII
jgi:two-component system, NarL family, response regulator DesR